MASRLTRRTALASAGALALLPANAWAHREKMTVTEVLWTDTPEFRGFGVTHRFHRHDAEVALSKAGLLDTPEIDSLESRAHMAIHVEETFSLNGRTLEMIGAEADGNRLWVYQELPLDALPERLDVTARMLRGLYADQINAVDVKVGGQVKSLRFAGDDGAKGVTL